MKTRQLIEEVENNFTKSLYDQKAFFLSGRVGLAEALVRCSYTHAIVCSLNWKT